MKEITYKIVENLGYDAKDKKHFTRGVPITMRIGWLLNTTEIDIVKTTFQVLNR